MVSRLTGYRKRRSSSDYGCMERVQQCQLSGYCRCGPAPGDPESSTSLRGRGVLEVFSHKLRSSGEGSILDPVLWNVMYDKLSRLKFPCPSLALPYDITLDIDGESIEDVEWQTPLDRVCGGMDDLQETRLDSPPKTKVITL